MELIENVLQFLVTLLGVCLSGIYYRRSRKQVYFLLTCFYGCFALGSLYWTLYLILFLKTPQVFYVSEFGWIASVIFLHILQYVLSDEKERTFPCRAAWLSVLIGVPLCILYCFYGDILSNLLWCGMMMVISYIALYGDLFSQGNRWERRITCSIFISGFFHMLPQNMRCGQRDVSGGVIRSGIHISGWIFC